MNAQGVGTEGLGRGLTAWAMPIVEVAWGCRRAWISPICSRFAVSCSGWDILLWGWPGTDGNDTEPHPLFKDKKIKIKETNAVWGKKGARAE